MPLLRATNAFELGEKMLEFSAVVLVTLYVRIDHHSLLKFSPCHNKPLPQLVHVD